MPGPPPPPPRLPPPPVPFGIIIKPPSTGDNNNEGRSNSSNDNAATATNQVGRPIMMPNYTSAAKNTTTTTTGGGDIDNVPYLPPRAPPPPMMMMNRINNNNNNAANNNNFNVMNNRQQIAPPPPPPVHHHQPQRQHFNNNGNNYSAPPPTISSQFNQLDISNAAPSSVAMPFSYTASGVVQQQQQQQQYRGAGGVTSNHNIMPPPPPPPQMPNSHHQQQQQPIIRPQPPMPPPPSMQHHPQNLQQQQSQFSNNAMQPPPYHPQQHQSQPSIQQQKLQSSSSTTTSIGQPFQPSRPQYSTTSNSNNHNNNNYNNYNNNNPKIDPSQIPRIPLFTRPHHAPAAIYPSCNNNYNNSYSVGNSSSSIVGGVEKGISPPPPPLDSRYIHNSTTTTTTTSFNNNNKNASPRLIATTTYTFPTDHKTVRSCGDLPLGLIVSPLACLTTLCLSRRTVGTAGSGDGGTNDNGGGGGGGGAWNGDERITATTTTTTTNTGTVSTTTTTSSTQWNGREQGDIYSENMTNTRNCRDVDYVISPFDGNGLVNMSGRGGGGSTNGTNEKENGYDDDDDNNDPPERIPVIRGMKRSIHHVTDDTTITKTNHPPPQHPSSSSSSASTRMKTTQTITPPRCNRCNAYLNPYCTPSSSSNSSSSSSSSILTNTFQGLIYTPTQSYNCNMCGSKSSIVINNEDYIANQIFETTALACGTVEYEVGGEYCVREGGAVENVFLYAVEYDVPDGSVGGGGGGVGGGSGGYVNQQHQHHGTMKSHGWNESLDGIRSVARELCITAPRREEDGSGVMVKEVKIGIFAFCRDMLVFPYIKRKGHNDGSKEEEEEEELAVAIVSDVTEDPFCPLPLDSWSYNVGDGLESKEWHRFCRVLDSFTDLMEHLLGESPHQQQPQQNDARTRNCGGAALAVLGDALKNSGGRGTLITTRRPNYGVGALRDREAVTSYGIGFRDSSAEQKLFTPLQHLVQRNNDAVGIVKDKPAGLFYKKLGEECAKNRVCLDIVVTSSSVSVPSTDPKQLNKNPNMREFLDVATLGELCRVTCGHFKWLRVGNECGVAVNGNKNDSFTAEQLREELKRSALAYTGSDVVFKLRCSTGVQVKSYSPTLPVGNLVGDGIVNSAELELSSMHPGTSFAVVLEHKIGGVVDTMNANSRKGIDLPMVFFQSAVLYTTKTGQRRVRVSTLGLPTSKVPADIFRSANLGAISTIFTRGAISDVERDGGSLRLARENVFNKCVSILANYRSHTTARASPSGQLILPESLQLLPLFCLSLRKSRMLRHSIPKNATSAKPFPTADERAYHIFYGRMVSPNMSLQCVHPHLFQVSDMRTRDGDWITPPVLQENKFDDANVIAASMRPVCQLPKTMNPSIACLDESGMYLLDDRFSFYLFIGRDVPDEKWQDLLSVGGVGSSRARGSSVPIGGLSLADTDSAHKLRSVIHQLRMLNSPNETLGLTARNTYAPLILVFVGRGSVFEEEMDSLLVDDPDTHERSYVDFLCDIHRSVRERDQT